MSDSMLENSKHSNCVTFSGKMSFRSYKLLVVIEKRCMSSDIGLIIGSNEYSKSLVFKKKSKLGLKNELFINGLVETDNNSLIPVELV